jgi:prophage regulatory protein
MQYAILRLPAVKARTGLSRSTIYARVKDGTFPAPVSLGARAVGWVEQEIDEHLAALVERRRTSARNGPDAQIDRSRT